MEKFCIVCGTKLSGQQTKYCSAKCKQKNFRLNHKDYNANYSANRDKEGTFLKLSAIEERGGKCEICGYNKNLASLEFHHRNPDEKEFVLDSRNFKRKSKEEINKELSKCSLLCSNCHQELHHPSLDMDIIIKERNEYIQKQICNKSEEENKFIKKNKCIDCGKEISINATRCVSCEKKHSRKIERPSREELFIMMKTLPVTTIANNYGVSDNAIRKWCKNYKLPTTKKDYKYLEEIPEIYENRGT